jgi:hypothetical protein
MAFHRVRWDRYKLRQAKTRLLAIAMQQIVVWLRKLGVSEHAERFAQDDIDVGLLSELAGHGVEKARLLGR